MSDRTTKVSCPLQESNALKKAANVGDDQSGTPFVFPPSIPSVPIDTTTAPSAAWMIGVGDQAQPFNMDPSLELLGLNLNELWGESWELG